MLRSWILATAALGLGAWTGCGSPELGAAQPTVTLYDASTGGSGGSGGSGECVPGSKRCEGRIPQGCEANGQWVNGNECQFACHDAKCIGQCTPGAKRCSGATPQACDTEGHWLDGVVCSGATPVCANGNCEFSCGGAACGPLEQCFDNYFCTAKLVPIKGGYSIDATEVTQAQYDAWLTTHPDPGSGQPASCAWNTDLHPDSICIADLSLGVPAPCEGSSCGSYPQLCIDWCDAFAYCMAVGKRLCGRIGGGANSHDDYADPTMSQWFHACTSGGAHNFPYGGNPEAGKMDGFDAQKCNGVQSGEQAILAVASHLDCTSTESGYTGVYDLSGNVPEWEDSCVGTLADDVCRTRGGSAWDYGAGLRCSADTSSNRTTGAAIGFRCCSDP